MELENCQITGNSAGLGGGGALYASVLDKFHLFKANITQNRAQGNGGAVALHNVRQMTVENSTLKENHSQNSGGGAHLESVQEVRTSL